MTRTTTALLLVTVALPCPAYGQDLLPPDSAIQSMVDDRVLAGWTPGLVLGIIRPDGSKRVFVHGSGNDGHPLTDRSVMEIGSVTKVFTGILLGEMVARGETRLEEPVRLLLPPETRVPEREGKAITLLDLTTHTSGLPRMPSNFRPTNPADPYVDYADSNLYEFLSTYTLPRDIGTRYEYSNLGVGLLGVALSNRARVPYEALLRQRLLAPLGLKETTITLTSDLRSRFVQGHDADGNPVAPWNLGTLVAAGGLRSTARDLLSFLQVNLGRAPKGPLGVALQSAREPRRQAGDSTMMVGLGWHIWKGNGHQLVWHNGATGGYHSFIGFDSARGIGVVILSNSVNDIDDLGFHLLDELRPLVASRSSRPVMVADSILQQYVGEYQLSPAFSITVEKKADRLAIHGTGQASVMIYPTALNEFLVRAVDARVVFEKDSTGAVSQLMLYQAGRELPARKIR